MNKVRERFVKDIEVKREVCFASLAWMPASEGWHEAGMTDFINYSTKPLVGEAKSPKNLNMKYFLLFLSCFFLLTACGQSGPLYLPKDYKMPITTDGAGQSAPQKVTSP